MSKAYTYAQHGNAEAGFARLIPDELVPRFAFAGTPNAIAGRIDALGHLGVDEVVLAIPFAPGITPPDEVMSQLAPALLKDN